MNRVTWKKIIQSWWGRSLAGAFIGALLVSFSGLTDLGVFVLGMAVGAVALYLLGRLE